jgi:hypothetical protein
MGYGELVKHVVMDNAPPCDGYSVINPGKADRMATACPEKSR